MLPEWEETTDAGYDAILVAFGGLGGEFGLPQFEFRAATSKLAAHRVFVRDTTESWYHGGAADTDSILGLASVLRRLIQPYRRSVFIGNSSGGYAALLLGALAGADQIVAFSPQTYLGIPRRVAHADYRWPMETARARARGRFDRSFASVRPALQRAAAQTRSDVYFASSHRLDRSHAQHIAGISAVTLYPVSGVGHHTLVRDFRDSGELLSALRSAVELPD